MEVLKTAVSKTYEHQTLCFIGFCEIMFPETPSFKGFGEIDVLKTAASSVYGPRDAVKRLLFD
eukprot:208348-Amphidinium_carterae.1